jgi:hypothetical protein
MVIGNLKGGPSLFCPDLRENNNTLEDHSMLVSTVTENVFQTLPLLEVSVDSLVPGPRPTHLMPVLVIPWTVGCVHPVISRIPFISNNFFPWIQEVSERMTEDSQIIEPTSRKWTVEPHNVSCIDCNSKFIAQCRTVEFVREPLSTKWNGFLYRKVDTINCHKTLLFEAVTSITIFQSYLMLQMEHTQGKAQIGLRKDTSLDIIRTILRVRRAIP